VNNKMKRILVISLTFLLLACSISIVAWAEQASNDTEVSDVSGGTSADVLASYEKAAENNRLTLYVNKTTLGMKVVDKENGSVWHGTLDEKDEKLNQTWQSFFESGLTVEYMDAKRKVRMAPVTGEHANIAIENIENGFSANVRYEKLGFSLKMDVRLTADAVEFKVPEASIEETNKDNRLQSVYMYPFFGATKGVQADKGYMFIPDGSGALISLNQATIATQPYIGRVYGEELGISGGVTFSDTLAYDPEKIYLPVFGIAGQEGHHAFVSMITGGAPYAEIRSYPSGVTTAYNWTAAKWIYREPYFQPVDKKGKGMTLNQEETNKFDASLKVMLLSGAQANYSGMAKRVQSELVQRGELSDQKLDGAKSIPLRIEILAADYEKQMIGHDVISMTTVQEMENMVDDLRANAVERMMVVIRGYAKGGSGASLSHLKFEGKVGSTDEWKAFVDKCKAMGIPVYFYTDYVSADKSAGGYGKDDIAQSIAKQFITNYYYAYFLQPAASQKLFDNQVTSFNKYGITNIAMESIGYKLFSTYVKSASTRSQSIETYQSMLSHDSIDSFALYRPNHYLWKYVDRVMDLPMISSSFLLETEDIPFLQLVLKGYVDYYAPASNFTANPQEELLKLIDYGSYPSYFLTDKDPIMLLKTGSAWLYTSQYSIWKDQIVRDYKTVVSALQPVAGATFEAREEVQEGVYRNRYSNGAVIYINYSGNEVTVDGNKVPSRGFLVQEGGRS